MHVPVVTIAGLHGGSRRPALGPAAARRLWTHTVLERAAVLSMNELVVAVRRSRGCLGSDESVGDAGWRLCEAHGTLTHSVATAVPSSSSGTPVMRCTPRAPRAVPVRDVPSSVLPTPESATAAPRPDTRAQGPLLRFKTRSNTHSSARRPQRRAGAGIANSQFCQLRGKFGIVDCNRGASGITIMD